MKQLILVLLLILVSPIAKALDMVVPVESKTGNKYYLQVLVPGGKASEVIQMTKIIQSVVPQITKNYSTVWLMDHRSVIWNRLEQEFKQANLYSDGIGILRLRMQDGKILDVE